MNSLFNMMNNPFNVALNVLKNKNPEAYTKFNQVYRSGENPEKLVRQMIAGMSATQVENAKQMMKQYGVPSDVLNKF